MIILIVDRLSWLGTKPLCNGYIPHSIMINGYCLPLCQRCTFIGIGLLFGFILIKKKQLNKITCFIFMVPMIIDGLLSNLRLFDGGFITRTITGFLFGIAVVQFINIFANYIEKIILNKKIKR